MKSPRRRSSGWRGGLRIVGVVGRRWGRRIRGRGNQGAADTHRYGALGAADVQWFGVATQHHQDDLQSQAMRRAAAAALISWP